MWKKVFLKNFFKFTGKHLCQSLFLNKVEGLKTATLLKKRQAQVFSCEFCEIFKNIFSQSNSGWMPLQGFIFWIFSNFQNSPSITYKNGTTCNNQSAEHYTKKLFMERKLYMEHFQIASKTVGWKTLTNLQVFSLQCFWIKRLFNENFHEWK